MFQQDRHRGSVSRVIVRHLSHGAVDRGVGIRKTIPTLQSGGQPVLRRAAGLANYLITTPQGHILINSDLEANVPMIRASIEKLGFKFTRHQDPADQPRALGSRRRQRAGQRADRREVHGDGCRRAGGRIRAARPIFSTAATRPRSIQPTKVDRVLHDGDEVKLGGTSLVAHLTPGHTKGCTTWTMKVNEGGKTYNVVIIGSPNVNPGYKLVNNAQYPGIAQDYERTFRVLKSCPCDIFLGAHGNYFGMEAKYANLDQGKLKPGLSNPFVDPQGYQAYVAEREQAFLQELARQRR